MINQDRLLFIKELIEDMNKCQQIEILKLLKSESAIVSENNNGTFINLTDLSELTIQKLEKYIEFVRKQHTQLLYIEKEKANIKNEFFTQENKNIKKRNKEVSNILINE